MGLCQDTFLAKAWAGMRSLRIADGKSVIIYIFLLYLVTGDDAFLMTHHALILHSGLTTSPPPFFTFLLL